jgi:hypothetical protein
MTFGRMNNMRRRTSRPDENFHRSRRRSNVDRSVMLNAARKRASTFARLLGALLSLFSRRH